MIALRDGLPLVSLPDGRNTLFDKTWIAASIRNAAEQAGYSRWWLAGHIAESVSVYLQRDFEAGSVGIPNLQEAVTGVLGSLGYGDVASHFRLPDPPVRLSLSEIAREAGGGYELAFFGLLGDRLQRVAGSHAARLEIHDLSGCIRLLGNRRNRARRLREEIVDFIRLHGRAAGSNRPGEPLEIELS
jgi:hypothetical protein